MCIDGKCCWCIPLETGALILAIFNTLVQLGSAIAGIVNMILLYNSDNNGYPQAHVFYYSGFIQMFAVGAVQFMFAVVLCFGITKKNLAYLKVFIVSAIVAIVLDAVGIMMYKVNLHINTSSPILAGLLTMPVLYPLLNIILLTLLLVTVVMTYKKMVKEVY